MFRLAAGSHAHVSLSALTNFREPAYMQPRPERLFNAPERRRSTCSTPRGTTKTTTSCPAGMKRKKGRNSRRRSWKSKKRWLKRSRSKRRRPKHPPRPNRAARPRRRSPRERRNLLRKRKQKRSRNRKPRQRKPRPRRLAAARNANRGRFVGHLDQTKTGLEFEAPLALMFGAGGFFCVGSRRIRIGPKRDTYANLMPFVFPLATSSAC